MRGERVVCGPMPWFRRSLLVLPVAVMLLASACGGSGGGSSQSATEKWADGVCSSLNTWKTSVTNAGASLSGGNLSEDQVKSAVSDVNDATTKLSSDLKGLGRPDTDSGQQAEEALTTLSTQLDQDVAQINQAVEGASGPTAAVGIATSVGASLSQMSTQVSAALGKLDNLDAKGELNSAFQKSDACTQLTGSGS
jgi:hypothetical protein